MAHRIVRRAPALAPKREGAKAQAPAVLATPSYAQRSALRYRGAMDSSDSKKALCQPPAAGLFGRVEEKASVAHGGEQLANSDIGPANMPPHRARDGQKVSASVD